MWPLCHLGCPFLPGFLLRLRFYIKAAKRATLCFLIGGSGTNVEAMALVFVGYNSVANWHRALGRSRGCGCLVGSGSSGARPYHRRILT